MAIGANQLTVIARYHPGNTISLSAAIGSEPVTSVVRKKTGAGR